MTQKTLKSFLSQEKLKEWAGEKVYSRGVNYHSRGNVDMLFYTPHKAVAEVSGTHIYRTEFGVSDDGELHVDCTCPAMNDWGFCKHAVATALQLLEMQPQTSPPPNIEEQKPDAFSKLYPNISRWIQDGCIEIGRDGYNASMIRIMDQGGLVWEGGTRHKSIDKMLAEAEKELEDWM